MIEVANPFCISYEFDISEKEIFTIFVVSVF
jgi:hypothetical protein